METTLSHLNAIGYHTKEHRDVLPFIPPDCNTLLDVGCGAAEFGARVKRKIRRRGLGCGNGFRSCCNCGNEN